MNRCAPLIGLILSVAVALIALYAYDGRRIEADDFALGATNTSRSDTWNGIPFTAHSIVDISALVHQHSRRQQNVDPNQQKLIAWLGNSQLHTLNQYKPGEHLAPYWLRQLASCEDCFVPLGLSLPNANPQEEFVLSQYVAKSLALSAVVLEVEFMGFRHDGVRAEFAKIVSADLVDSLRAYPVGKNVAALAADGAKKREDVRENSGIDSVVQQDLENFLSEQLSGIWPLWKDRVNLRSTLLGDLFTFRNWALNIKSTSQRKVIKPRYQRNMRALEDFLANFRDAHIPVVLYFAPVRPDLPSPYDRAEYAQWKTQVEALAQTYGASYVNLEKLVPGAHWGSNFGDDVDFMHFQEPGHKLVAEALYPVIQARLR